MMAGTERRKAVVAITLAQPLMDQLSVHDVTYLPTARWDKAALMAAVADAEGLLVSSHVKVDRDVIAAAPKLQVISTMSVGSDHIDVDAARERGITVTITPVLSDAVADLTMALMTMLSRRIPDGMRSVSESRWVEGTAMLGSDLTRKVLLLVGFGRIGQAVANRALAAGMDVRYVDPRNDLPEAAGVSRVAGLAEGLEAADFVSLHIDLNPGTRNLMGPAEFASMKRSAFFVNTSRGGVVDQPALAAALTSGRIDGAALDVLVDEPPNPWDALLSAPNVIIVPHIGSATRETRDAMAQCAVDNLLMVLRGETSPSALS
jgi:lactate dehydrogenase-like 2-hydroxyacid dehydrogenase